MKKSLLLTLLLAAFFVVGANPVDVDTAKETGKTFLETSTNVRSVSSLELVLTYHIARGDAAFYVFNTENSFVIVAADDCANPILAYSDEGSFDLDNMPIQFQEYLESFVEQIEYGIVNNISYEKQANLSPKTGVNPLLSSLWGGGTYYNSMCPEDPSSSSGGHAMTGCVATAMGQLMYYHKKPVTGNGSHSYKPSGYPTQTANFGATTYDWAHMTDKLDANSTADEISAIATLLWHCGVATNMNYGVSSSSTSSQQYVPNALLNYFRYSSDLSYAYRRDFDDAVWLARVEASLDLRYPVYYIGNSVSSTGNIDGHAFICDGYDANEMLHMNWGWNGNNNCYVAVDVVNGGNYQFKFDNYAIFNVHPDGDAPLTHTVSAIPNNTTYGTAAVSGTGNFANGASATITATANDGYIFNYWSENGGVVSTNPEYTFDVYYSRNIEANFSTPDNINVTVAANDTGFGTASGGGACDYGDSMTVVATPNSGYAFCYWLENNVIVSADASYTFTATDNRNLVACFADESTVCELVYYFIDSYGDGWTGNKLVVEYDNTYTETMELSDGLSGSFPRKVADGSSVKLSWVMGKYVSECQFALKYNNGVVFYEKSGLNAAYSYTFNMNCSGGTDDVFESTGTTLWSDVANWQSGSLPSATAITDIKSDVDVDMDVTVATMNLYDNVTLTINPGATLRVNGTMTELPDSKIVIQDGGQFINQTPGVTGIVEKEVIAWTTTPYDDGWYAISTPINDIMFEAVTNLTNEIYNVYRYDEPTTTWENSMNGNNPFNSFESGRGYLYRRNVEAKLEFSGSFNVSYYPYQLSYTSASGNLKGFHLVGNPYTHNIYKGANTAFYNYSYLEDGFYTLQTNGTWQAGIDHTTPIKPCEAVLVQAKPNVNQVMYFVNSPSAGSSKDAENIIRFAVSNNYFEDVAYAIIKEGEGLSKIEHRNEDAQMLYIRNNDEDYAVADIDEDIKVFGLYFKSMTTGVYTLEVNADGDFGYLHIIDKLTGEDLDMLLDKKYSFVSSPTDAADRFVVKLAPWADVFTDDSFAFQNGDDIIVSGEGTLQIYDITGRMVSSIQINGEQTMSATSLSGVYVFRLIGDDVKTQKIVVK